MKVHRVGYLAVGLTAALLVSGCGRSGHDQSSSATITVPKAGTQLPLSTTVDIKGNADEKLPVLESGWSFPEDWGVWSEGSDAVLHITTKAPVKTGLFVTVTGNGFIDPKVGKQAVVIQVDGRKLGDWVLPSDSILSDSFVIPPAIAKGKSDFHIHFLIAHPVSPAQLGHSDDKRMMGLGLRSILIQPLSAISTPVGKMLTFSTGNRATKLLLASGWSAQENWGVWTDGPQAQLLIRPTTAFSGAVTVHVAGNAFINSKTGKQVINVKVGDRTLATWTYAHNVVQKMSFVIPADVAKGQSSLRLTFAIEYPQSPKDQGKGDDSRQLGFGLRQIGFFPIK